MSIGFEYIETVTYAVFCLEIKLVHSYGKGTATIHTLIDFIYLSKCKCTAWCFKLSVTAGRVTVSMSRDAVTT